ncbi:MAG TPA: MFS transporter [Dehalococcoidia bacterium]|jgi:MFS family permease|nr:MFS transporter [Dehalococcoidia bacterium]
MIIGTVPIFQGMTAWFVVLEREFGWSRAQLSLAFSLTRAEGTIMGPLAGYLVDKVGPRRMVLSGLPVMGIGFILFSQVNNLWQFYGAFVLASMGAGFGTWLPMMTVLNHWFQKRRSMAMSLAMEGFALGGVLLMPALAWAIDPDEPDRLGWRLTAAGIGVVLIILAWPVSRLIRNRPEEYGLRPDGRPENQPERGERVGSGQGEGGIVDFTWQEALRTRPFWLITIGHSATSIVIVTLTVHLGPMLTDLGYSLQMVAWVVSTYTGVGAVFTLVGGYIGDRVPMHLALFGFSVIQSVAVVILLSADTLPMILLFAVVLGIGFGGRTPMTTAIRGVYFGRRAFASITGISMIPMNIMLLVFPLFAGIMFDAVGSYQIPFSVLAIVSFFGAAMFLLLGKPSLKVG